MKDENKIHEIKEIIEDCYKRGKTIEDLEWYVDTEEAAEKVYDWIMENMNQKKAVEEFKDKLIDYALNHGGYDKVVDIEDIESVFDSLYSSEKPKLPKFRVDYYSYREGLEGEYTYIVEAESVEDAIDIVKDRCYQNYSTCEIRSIAQI